VSRTAKAPITVMVVDDHPLWRETVRKILEYRKFARVVAEAADGQEAVELAREAVPDVVVMDIQLPRLDGIAATRALVRDRPGGRVLVLASSEDRAQVLSAVNAGASGYLLKTATSKEVTDAVGRVHNGELVFPPALAGVVLDALRDPGPDAALDIDRSVFRRDGDFWTVAHEGAQFLLRDTRGAKCLSQLLRNPGREIHALDLIAPNNPVAASSDAPEVLDAKARAALKQRMADLAEDLEEAESWNDVERAAQARQELEAIAESVARDVGLGGRSRRASNAAERARVNVTLAIRGTIAKIAENAPALGAHLNATVKTGTYCSYTPDPRISTTWEA
jgi:DNA-binding NarL/FixJ family response regulator